MEWQQFTTAIYHDVHGPVSGFQRQRRHPPGKRGACAQQGMKIGHLIDHVGKAGFAAMPPASGVMLYARAVPSIVKGDTIASIGVSSRRRQRRSDWSLGGQLDYAPILVDGEASDLLAGFGF